jgi:uncharacterized membrane protein
MTPRRRIAAAVALGGVAGGLAGMRLPWQAALLVGWIVGASLFLGFVARLVFDDSVDIEQHATRDDPGRVAAGTIDVGASVGCLVGVGFALAKANEGGGHYNIWLVVLGVLSVVASWAVLHSVFLLHYAHLFYRGPNGGIDFADVPPRYIDFAYLSFTIGMTYQVSDTQLCTREVRKHALAHALLSFFFGTFILAVTINVVAGFVR